MDLPCCAASYTDREANCITGRKRSLVLVSQFVSSVVNIISDVDGRREEMMCESLIALTPEEIAIIVLVTLIVGLLTGIRAGSRW